MAVPDPTPILRFLHIDNLAGRIAARGTPCTESYPKDGLIYKTIHNTRHPRQAKAEQDPLRPRGVIHDYVPFYFGFCRRCCLLKTGA